MTEICLWRREREERREKREREEFFVRMFVWEIFIYIGGRRGEQKIYFTKNGKEIKQMEIIFRFFLFFVLFFAFLFREFCDKMWKKKYDTSETRF